MLKALLKGIYFIEHGFDKIRWSYLRKFNRIGPIMLQSYTGLGNTQKAYVRGRLIEKRNIRSARSQDSRWQNLVAMYRRFESYEIPGVRVQAEFYGKLYEATTDQEGYFEFQLQLSSEIDRSLLWHPVAFTVLDKIGKNDGPVKANGRILIPQGNAEYGIISDIDDTVLQTGATSFIRMMQKTFLYNAKTRLPFKGVAAFYRALHEGSQLSPVKNPLYYVSSSPWNLFDMLVDFLEIQKIPAGPLMLRNIGLDAETLFSASHKNHKLKQIEKIFTYTGDLPFILVGDSGQKDPEIYLEVVRRHPGRIRAVYIRDVSKAKRDQLVHTIIDEVQTLGSEMLFVKDTEAATRHAIGQGFIRQEELDDVQREKRKDEEA
jgi:phosphatidate phosphatase APP1